MSTEEKSGIAPVEEETEKKPNALREKGKEKPDKKKKVVLWTDGHRQYVFDEVVELVSKGLTGEITTTAAVKRFLETAKIGGVKDYDVARVCAECVRRQALERRIYEEKEVLRRDSSATNVQKPPLTDVTLRTEPSPTHPRLVSTISLSEDSDRRISVPPSKAPICADVVLWSRIQNAMTEEDDGCQIAEACLDGVAIIIAASILKKVTRRESEFYYQVPRTASLIHTHLDDIMARLSVILNYDLDVEKLSRGDGSLACLHFSLGERDTTQRPIFSTHISASPTEREQPASRAYGTSYEYDPEIFEIVDEEDGSEAEEEDEEDVIFFSSDEETSTSFLAKAFSRFGPEQPVKED